MVVQSSPVPYWDLGIGPITCHAWNKDRTQLAVSASSNLIHIYELQGNSWNKIHTLSEHELQVTSIDWAPNSNRIVSCSYDKNTFVWALENGTWKETMVVTRTEKSLVAVKWSPLENKIAVCTGSKQISICTYNQETDWWVPKVIKKPISSTVTCVDWHPNNVLIAVGSCEMKIRVFSAYVKGLDEKQDPNPWGSKMHFGDLMTEYRTNGWPHSVAFSPSGCCLAWASHDSTLSIVDKTDNPMSVPVTYKSNGLPIISILWSSESEIIAAGYDCQPILFKFEANIIKLISKLDVPSESKNSNLNSAFQMFQNFTRTASEQVEGIQLKTLHQNTIIQLQPYSGRPGGLQKFSTCSIDGLIAFWDIKSRIAAANKSC